MDKVKINKINVWSTAKTSAVVLAVLSLFFAIAYLVFMTIYFLFLVSSSESAGIGALGGAALELAMLLIIAPIISCVLGFICGAISAVAYNTFARFSGGIEIEVKKTN